MKIPVLGRNPNFGSDTYFLEVDQVHILLGGSDIRSEKSNWLHNYFLILISSNILMTRNIPF